MSDVQQLIDVVTVAEMLGVSARHIIRMSARKKMPRPVKIGHSVRWIKKQIEEWISQGCPEDQANPSV